MSISKTGKYGWFGGLARISLAVLALLPFLTGVEAQDDLFTGFRQPPDSARPWVYWFIMDGNLSRDGITADFEALQAAGIGGVIIMEVNVGIPRGPVAFMSDPWCDLFRHAVLEAERLGLEITLNAGPGWTGSGGPWVKPERSMQHLVASAVEVVGPAHFDESLPCPQPREPFFGSVGLPPELTQARNDFYADVALLAFPRPTDESRLADVDEKALYVRAPYTSRPGVKPCLAAPATYPEFPAGAIIPKHDVVDLTDRLADDGRLTWEVPPGNWTILRFGRRNTGANTRPAPQPGLGLESDKFDSAALDAHFDAFVGRLLRAVGPRPAKRTRGWTMLHIDSWEMGAQNWTAGFRGEFQRRRGYDPLPYLPAMTGRVVQSLETSERFLWDLRLTAQELVVENHAEHLKRLGRRHGFGLSIEPYDMNPTADMTLGSVADVPMCEFWSRGHGFDSAFSCYEAASIADTLGRPVVAAEAFTAASSEAWTLFPAAMKEQGDWAFCTGINRLVFHRYAHQPWLDRRPGMTMGPYGVHWDRTQTWWPMIAGYHRYVARCQFLLRQGTPVADICYLAAEGAPHVFRPPPSALSIERDRRRYRFAGCTPETLLAGVTVKDGRIAFPSGAAFSLLLLPAVDTMTPLLLEKIAELVEAGATIVGNPPRNSPSLSGYPECDRQVQALSTTLWDDATRSRTLQERPGAVQERSVGQGKVVSGGKLEVSPDEPSEPRPIRRARWIWHPEAESAQPPPPATRFFRRVVTIAENQAVRSARVEITADNDFRLWINGREVAQGNNFHQLYTADVAPSLTPGENLLAVEAVNGGESPNPAGLIAALKIDYRDGGSQEIVTDRSWRVSRSADENWRLPGDVSSEWDDAVELGPIDMAPWHLQPVQTVFPDLYPDYSATADLLEARGLPPDFESDGAVRFIHRRTREAEIYFVANALPETSQTRCIFRTSGAQPELWDPLTATRRVLPEYEVRGGRTVLPLRFEPHQSFFVVFPRTGSEGAVATAGGRNFPPLGQLAEIRGPWDVTFDTSLGGPDHAQFSTLEDWTRRTEPEIKYYSGIATYRNTFDLPKEALRPGRPLFLNLGEVHSMARVRLNGRDLGVVWCSPWQVEITDAAKPSGNCLEIDVANLWPNRLIGDQGLPAEKRVTWTTWNPYRADSPLLPSGLLGPLGILSPVGSSD
jgi:hypothetical protein